MANVSKSAVDKAITGAEQAAAAAMSATGETGANTGLALEKQDKQKKKFKDITKKIGQQAKENPQEMIGKFTEGLSEPLSEYRAHQRQKQAVPTAEELAPPPVNLAAAFDI